MHLLQPGAAQQGAHGAGLVPAVFQQQPAARFQVRRSLGDDGAYVLQAVGAAGQRLQRLVCQGRQVRVGGGDVGRVGDDGVENTFQSLHPLPVAELHGQPSLASTASTLASGRWC